MSVPPSLPPGRRRRGTGSVQIRDVARLASVSAVTVSRFLNDPGKVAAATRERIAAAIAATGYIPNLPAKALSSNRTTVVATIVPTITNSIFADFIAGLSDVLEENGLKLLISASGYRLDREAELIETLIGHRPAGIIVTGQAHSPRGRRLLSEAAAPVVETWEIDGPTIDLGVGFSNFRASRAMTRWLVARGYRRIAFVSAPVTDNDRARRRLDGHLSALQEAGLRPRRDWVRQATFSFSQGAAEIAAMLDRPPAPEAVFFANDVLAIGALTECMRRGVRVPEDVAICGFDDVDLAALTTPPLTTVRIPRYEMGRRAAEMVLSRAAGPGRPEERRVDLGFRIVARGSTAGPA